ncbi:MAG: class I SAM-dependent methyltransferase [Candidatus Manganitrophaceae bacterium]
MKERLSQPEFWEGVYGQRRKSDFLPNPKKYRLHYEMDHVFKALFRPDRSVRLLELGAGGSVWLPYFAKEFGFQVYGIDYSKEGCEQAKKNLELGGVKGKILCEDFFDMGDKWKDFFDVIISFGVIEHFDKPVDVIRLLKGLLKSGHPGLIVTMVPNTAGLLFQLQKLVDEEVFNIHKIFSLKDLSAYHREAGMEVVSEQYLQFMDFGILNYQRVLKEKRFKLVARGITGINLPILYLQKVLDFYPQSKRWSSSMLVVARKGKEIQA